MDDKQTATASTTVNARAAATMLGVHYSTIRLWIATKQLPAEKVSGEWVIPLEAIEEKAKSWQPVHDLDVVNAASDAARYLAEWHRTALLDSMAQVIRSCRNVTDAFGDAEKLRDAGAAECAAGERLETLYGALEQLGAEIAQLEGVRALHSVIEDARAEANRLAREWDKQTKTSREQIQRDRDIQQGGPAEAPVQQEQ